MTDSILHYGILRRSGRYPWGSGSELLSTIDNLSSKGLSETDIAKGLGISTTALRNQKTLAKLEQKEAQRIFITRQKTSGMSITGISKDSGIPESTVRDLLRPGANAKFRLIRKIANILKVAVSKFKYIDIGEGVEQFLGVTGIKMKNAIALLQNEGYTIHYLREEQLGTGKRTSIKVLAAPGVTFSEVYENRSNITIPNHTSADNGHSFDQSMPINNVDNNRIMIVFDSKKDGLIEIRPNVDDLSLNGKRYAQVRIGVDGDKYLKGVAVYSNTNMPLGKDIVFYTSKKALENPIDILKEQDLTSPNPFGSTVKQQFYIDSAGNQQASALNIVYSEGDWAKWGRNLSSQFLSKQSTKLAEQQLGLISSRRRDELEEINALTNGTLKRHLLEQYATSVDSDAVHLKAAALPRQSTNLLIPIPSIKENEVFAPKYRNGDNLVLIRHPHGGIFELPTVIVNNKNLEARQIIGSDAKDAIGIHPKVAQRLSGADFDGDTVIAIPSGKHIKTSPALVGLKDFDPKLTYPGIPGAPTMTDPGKQMQMGIVSNLITDMTIRGASQSEIARAVRHSMVVIDAKNHGLNYKQSYIDNGIASLKSKYQGSGNGGASTVISKAKSTVRVPQRKDYYEIDPTTGEKIFVYTDKTYVDSKGREYPKMTTSTKMYEVSDARTLGSGTRIENLYASHANTLKGLGDQARLASLSTKTVSYSPSARRTYAKEVSHLEAKLRLAMRNQPLERKAQLVAGEIYRAKLANNPGMSAADKKTARGRALVLSRARVGAKKPTIKITPGEWEAIQMGAITPTMLKRIIRNADSDQIRLLATPRARVGLSPGKITRATTLLGLGYTRAEVASSLGVSVSQLDTIDLNNGD